MMLYLKQLSYLFFLFLLYLIIPKLFGIPPWAPQLGTIDLPFSSDQKKIWKTPKKLVLHILPHTHNDLGWNLTFEEYYLQYVRSAMRNSVIELYKNPKRRMTWGDSPYIEMWLSFEGHLPNNILSDPKLAKITWLQLLTSVINNGQFEFAGLEYSSPDEFLSTLYSQFTNMDVGRRYLSSNFNLTSRVGWHIDNFGHRQTTPLLLKANGIDKLLLGRMSFRKEQILKASGGYQFNWNSLFNSSSIFSHYLSIHYGYPARSFDFDRQLSCNPNHLIKLLNNFAISQVPLYPSHGQILVMMGDDFRFVYAKRAYECLDSIIDLSNSNTLPAFGHGNSQISIRYSTVSEYMASVTDYFEKNPDLRSKLPDVNGDLGQYNDIPLENYWTGIYSTRPFLKFYVRKAERLLRQSEASLAFSKLSYILSDQNRSLNANLIHSNNQSNSPSHIFKKLEDRLESSRKQLSITLHHDAITGTCTPGTYQDYIKRLDDSINTSTSVLINSTNLIIIKDLPENSVSFIQQVHEADSFDDEIEGKKGESSGSFYINSTLCNDTDCKMISLMALNYADISKASKLISLKLHTNKIEVIDSTTNKPVPLQVEYHLDELYHPKPIQSRKNDFNKPQNDGIYNFLFVAENIPPLSYKIYYLKHSSTAKTQNVEIKPVDIYNSQANLYLSSNPSFNNISISIDHFNLGQIILNTIDHKVAYEQRYYLASKFRGSGAYLFHSNIQMYIMIFFYIIASLIAGMILHSYTSNISFFKYAFGYYFNQNNIYVDSSLMSPNVHLRKHSIYTQYDKKLLNSRLSKLKHIIQPICWFTAVLLIGVLLGIIICLVILQLIPDDLISSWSNNQSVSSLIIPFLAFGYYIRKFSSKYQLILLSSNFHFIRSLNFVPKNSNSILSVNRFLMLIVYGFVIGIFFALFTYPEYHSRAIIPNGFIAKMAIGNLLSSLTIFYNDSKTTIQMISIPSDSQNNPVVKIVTTLTCGKNMESLVRLTYKDRDSNSISRAINSIAPNIFKPKINFHIDDTPNQLQYQSWTSIPGNYHSLLHKISTSNLGVQVKQAMGATCIAKDSLEFIAHRSFLQNDLRGLWGTLTDYTRVSISHYLDFTPNNKQKTSRYFNADQPTHLIAFYNNSTNSKMSDEYLSLKQLGLSNIVNKRNYISKRSLYSSLKTPSHVNIIGLICESTPLPSKYFDEKGSLQHDLYQGDSLKKYAHLYFRFSSFQHNPTKSPSTNIIDLDLTWIIGRSYNIEKIYRVSGDYGFVNDKFINIFGNGDKPTSPIDSQIKRVETESKNISITDGSLELYHLVVSLG
ncbi:Alpha-mannosidase 2x [Smittium culicis]|uniref:Alpha-mannosidase 2x n=1 Tax=Smittium culicis TaxID=133412 RepID=A0A1R1YUC6_9FUNG|nr:Alpha-mannosidase 2x [Smittium culicis]